MFIPIRLSSHKTVQEFPFLELLTVFSLNILSGGKTLLQKINSIPKG